MTTRLHAQGRTLMILGFTAAIVGYLSVWLPGPGAGLTLLGVEMGEWFKFAGLGARRDIFYLPPITIGLMLALWTIVWPQQRWTDWIVRGLAILVGLLAFPAVADITGPVYGQYVLRAGLTLIVMGVAVLSGFWRPAEGSAWLIWAIIAALGLIGGILPAWMYSNVRPFAAELFGVDVGFGLGVWLNGLGQLLVAVVCLWKLRNTRHAREILVGES